MTPARQPHLHENPDMICASFHRISVVQPENCYNCVHRHGYPQYLFGDEHCDSFVEIRTHTSAPSPLEDVDCHSCRFSEQCRPTSYIPPCYNHGPDSPAAAAKAEREQTRKNTIIELLNHFKFSCPGGQANPICDMCGANQYCIELRSQQEAEHPSTKGGAR